MSALLARLALLLSIVLAIPLTTGVATLAAAQAPAPAPGPAPAGTVVLSIRGSCPLRAPDGLFGDGEASLFDVTMALRTALMRSTEPNVVLDCARDFHPALATCEELASVIRKSKGAKHVAILLNNADDRVLVIAAACDEVLMPQAGMLQVGGLSLGSYYFSDALAKLGVTFHAVISGAHKTAPEAVTRSAPSNEAKEEFQELCDGLDGVIAGELARGPLTADQLRAARALYPQTSTVAVGQKLVDRAVEPDGWLAALPAPIRHQKEKGRSTPDFSSMSGMFSFFNQIMEGEQEERQPKVVAVVELMGEIGEGESSEPGTSIAPVDTVAMLDELKDDQRVVGVVLRLDSPGGSAEASDRIHHAVERLAAKKPVVALFDRVCASGGYYIGCAAPEILVHPGTITGSIGVFALMPDISGTLTRLGIGRFEVSSGPRADLFSLSAWSDDKEAALRAVVEDTDRRFQAIVAAHRHLDAAVVAKLAGGRVYTGTMAVQNKLADGFGTLVSAVERVRQLAHEDQPLPLERYPKDSGLLARLGLANTALGLLPARLKLWADIAAHRGPSVLAWCNCTDE